MRKNILFKILLIFVPVIFFTLVAAGEKTHSHAIEPTAQKDNLNLFSFIDDPRWQTFDDEKKQAVLDIVFSEEVESDPRWNTFDPEKKAMVRNLFMEEARNYETQKAMRINHDNIPVVFVFACVIASVLIVIIFIVAKKNTKKRKSVRDSILKKCPYCAEKIQDDAIKCRYCGEWLNKDETNIIPSSHFSEPLIEAQYQEVETLKDGVHVSATSIKQKHKFFSWKSFLAAFLIAVFLNAFLSEALGVEPRKNVTWTVLWIYLSIEAWKFWRWRALLPYPLIVSLTVIFQSFISSSIPKVSPWSYISIMATFNLGGLIFFYLLLRKTIKNKE